MGVWTVISSFMNVEACLLGALNRVRIQGIFSILAAIANLGLSILLVKQIGSVGVILGTVLSYVLLLVGPQTWVVLSYFREIRRKEQLTS
jgi:O-antigen/teichoic acid export membrane protein